MAVPEVSDQRVQLLFGDELMTQHSDSFQLPPEAGTACETAVQSHNTSKKGVKRAFKQTRRGEKGKIRYQSQRNKTHNNIWILHLPSICNFWQ